MDSKSYFNNKSFTLIEVLVVIAIIGLLASIILVSMRGVQSKAKITKTLEFSQSLNHALGAYAIGVWGFDEGSGTTAKDGSGYGNDGVINGAVYTSDTPQAAAGRGTGKYALSFDGAGDYVDAGSGTSLNFNGQSFTAEAWINSAVNADGAIFGRLDWPGAGWRGWNVYVPSNGSVQFLIGNGSGGGGTAQTAASLIQTGQWYHIAGTFNGSISQIFVNGVLRGSLPVASFADPGVNTRIGDNNRSYFFNGLIDEVRIYERALSLSEIQRHYAEGLQWHQNLAIK